MRSFLFVVKHKGKNESPIEKYHDHMKNKLVLKVEVEIINVNT